MRSSIIKHYRGYAISPSAHRLPDGCFSSNLTLRRSDVSNGATSYEFYSLEYFGSEEAALRHSDRWAREWIDNRG
ncbi:MULTISPECIES: hypothetical protein [Burkholderia]|uniref:hypothetical protein n=1 Tax=Burkholderia TaxID=32008 RepID=UPI000572552C|nr:MULTISPECIES: hypothetical protein [Burkholderia]KWZ47372.1 hypothetical protein WS73_01920 [Burkholderia savannae]